MPNNRGTKASFGSLRTLPSGRIQARYTGPDGLTHKAPITFDTKGDAQVAGDRPRRHGAGPLAAIRQGQADDVRGLRERLAGRSQT